VNTAIKLALFAALTGFALAPALAAPPEKDAPKLDARPVVVPFELLKSRHMALQVKINGKGPYRVIFDTGAPTNLLNNKVAKEAGVLTKADKGGLPLFGAAAGAKTIKQFEVGDVKLEGMNTMVMDHPTVAAIAEAVGPIEGLIGYPFFARYKMTIDYEKKELTLVPNGVEPGDTMTALQNKLMGGLGAPKDKKPEPTILAPAGVWGFAVDKEDKDESAGVKIAEVLAKSPAAEGGLKVGDRLLTLDGRWTDSLGDTYFAASKAAPGKPAVLVVVRGGKELKLTVTPAKGL
jgi:hypothetical protein